MPLVIVKVAPVFEQTPALEKVTTPPGAFAATLKLVLKTALAGACVVTVIVWSAFCAVTVSVDLRRGVVVAVAGLVVPDACRCRCRSSS